MNPTLTEVRADLHALVSTASFDMTVLDLEPIGETPGNVFATVALLRSGFIDSAWQIRVYVSYRDAGSESARTLDEVLDAVHDALTTSDLYTAEDFEVGVDQELESWVARSQVTRGREDF